MKDDDIELTLTRLRGGKTAFSFCVYDGDKFDAVRHWLCESGLTLWDWHPDGHLAIREGTTLDPLDVMSTYPRHRWSTYISGIVSNSDAVVIALRWSEEAMIEHNEFTDAEYASYDHYVMMRDANMVDEPDLDC